MKQNLRNDIKNGRHLHQNKKKSSKNLKINKFYSKIRSVTTVKSQFKNLASQ